MAASSSSAAAHAKNSKFEDAIVSSPPIDFAQTKPDEVELWAIRVPPGFDVSRLDELSVSSAGARGDGFTLRAAPGLESGSIISAFPSAKKNRWMLGKAFARQLTVVVPPPPADTGAASVPPPLPPVPPKRGLRLSRPFPDIAPHATPANVGPASSRKRATKEAAATDKAPASKQSKAAKKRK